MRRGGGSCIRDIRQRGADLHASSLEAGPVYRFREEDSEQETSQYSHALAITEHFGVIDKAADSLIH